MLETSVEGKWIKAVKDGFMSCTDIDVLFCKTGKYYIVKYHIVNVGIITIIDESRNDLTFGDPIMSEYFDVENPKDFLPFNEFDSAIKEPDNVNHPPHYTSGKIEVIEFIEDQKFNYHRGNAIKYLSRAGKKNDIKEDLKKAIWYIQREIDSLEKQAK